jgi:hypothetical protein
MTIFEEAQTIGQQEPITPEQTQDSFVDQLAQTKGENWRDPEVLAKGKIEADTYIQNLEGQLAEMRVDLNKQDYAKEILETLQNKATDTSSVFSEESDHTGGTNLGDTPSSVSEDHLKSLVEKTLSQREKDTVVRQNIALVEESLKKEYGDAAPNKVSEKAKELGMSPEKMQEIASESPSAFFTLLGKEHKTLQPMVSGSVRTESVNLQASTERDWSYYQAMRRENSSKYFTPSVQRQLMEDKMRLGDKFGNT